MATWSVHRGVETRRCCTWSCGGGTEWPGRRQGSLRRSVGVLQRAARPKPGLVPLLPFPAQPVAQADAPAARRLASTLGIAGQAVRYSIKVSACRRELNSHEAASPQSHARFTRPPRSRGKSSVSAVASTRIVRNNRALPLGPELQALCQAVVFSVEATPFSSKSFLGCAVFGMNAMAGNPLKSRPAGSAHYVALAACGQGGCTWPRRRFVLSGPRALPNPSVNATANGVAPGPRSTVAYHVLRGPGTTPSSARYLKRCA
jgi:hypothetical protein